MKAHKSNYTEGRVSPIDRIVIHVSQGSLDSTLNWFANPKANVSAHYVIAQDGKVFAPVPEEDTAWHAGKLAMNARSIGIELIGVGEDYAGTEPQLEACAKLIAGIAERHDFPVDEVHVIPHNAVKPTKCPAAVHVAALIKRAASPSRNRLRALVLHLPGLEPVVYRGKALYTLRDGKLDVRFDND